MNSSNRKYYGSYGLAEATRRRQLNEDDEDDEDNDDWLDDEGVSAPVVTKAPTLSPRPGYSASRYRTPTTTSSSKPAISTYKSPAQKPEIKPRPASVSVKSTWQERIKVNQFSCRPSCRPSASANLHYFNPHYLPLSKGKRKDKRRKMREKRS